MTQQRRRRLSVAIGGIVVICHALAPMADPPVSAVWHRPSASADIPSERPDIRPHAGAAVRMVDQYGGAVRAVDVRGGSTFVGVGPRVAIVDVRDPGQPRELGRSEVLPGIVEGIVVQGNTAYVADGEDGGLRLLDVSDPTRVQSMGFVDTPGDAQDVFVSGQVAYVADGAAGGLRLIDVADPAHPREVGSVDTPDEARQVVVADGYAYVADAGIWTEASESSTDDGQLVIVDVREPTAPHLVQSVDPGGDVHAVAVSGNLVYVTARNGVAIGSDASGIAIVDISDPTSPSIRAFLEIGDGWDDWTYLTLAGDFLFASGHVVDVSDPDAPVRVGVGPEGLRAVVDGNAVYAAADEMGLVIRQWVEPSELRIVGQARWPAYTGKMVVEADRVHALDLDELWVLEVTAAEPAAAVGRYEARFESMEALEVTGDVAFLGIRSPMLGARVEVLDVSQPSRPGRIGLAEDLVDARVIGINGPLAYVGGGFNLHVLDATDPVRLRKVADLPDWGSGEDVAMGGQVGFLVSTRTAGCGLWAIDIQDPRRPRGLACTKFWGNSLALHGTTLFALRPDALQVLDVADSKAIRLVGQLSLPDGHRDIALWGQFAILAADSAGVRVIDVADPRAPVEVASIDTPGRAVAVDVDGDLAWVADKQGGVVALQLSTMAAASPPSGRPRPGLPPPAAPSSRRDVSSDVAAASADGGERTALAIADAVERVARKNRREPGLNATGLAGEMTISGQLGGTMSAVATDGEAVVLGVGPRAALVDTTDARQPRLAAQSEVLPGIVHDVAVDGDRVLAAVGAAGLWLLEHDGGPSLRPVAHVEVPGVAQGIAKAGDIVYVAAGDGGLRLFDVSVFGQPRALGALGTAGPARDVVVVDSLALVAADVAGLRVVDVAKPDEPREVRNLDLPGEAMRLAVSGDLVAVADGSGGLQLASVADPGNPRLVGSRPQPDPLADGEVYDVAMAGGYAYVAGTQLSVDGGNGVLAVDVHEPADPTAVGWWTMSGRPTALALAGRVMAVTGAAGLHLVDVTEPAYPVATGVLDTLADAVAVTTRGPHIAASSLIAGLTLVDVGDPERPVAVGYHAVPGGAQTLAATPGFGYLAQLNGLGVLEWRGSSGVRAIGWGGLEWQGGGGRDMAADGDVLVLPGWGRPSLLTVDVGSGFPAPILGWASLAKPGLAVAKQDNFVYVGTDGAGIQVVDVSDRSRPRVSGGLPDPAVVRSLAVIGDRLVVVGGVPSRLVVVDIGEPTRPTMVGEIALPGAGVAVAAAGDEAVVADGPAGVHLVHLAADGPPTITASVDTPGLASDVVCVSVNCYVADGPAGLLTVQLPGGPKMKPRLFLPVSRRGSDEAATNWGRR